MTKSTKTNTFIIILVLLCIISFALSITLLYGYNVVNQNLNRLYGINNNYSVLQSNFTHLRSQLSNLTVAHSMLESKYEQLDSNYSTLKSEYKDLNTPYIQKLYKNGIIFIANESLLSTSLTWLEYNAHYGYFSFYAPYNGSLILNYSISPTIENGNVELDIYNNFSAPETVDLSISGTLVKIPIFSGTNFVKFVNYNNKNITINFSAEYIGYKA